MPCVVLAGKTVVRGTQGPEWGTRSSGAEVTGSCLSSGPQEEQRVLGMAEPSLQVLIFSFLKKTVSAMLSTVGEMPSWRLHRKVCPS